MLQELNVLLKGIWSKMPFGATLTCFFFLVVLEETKETLYYANFAHHSW